MLLLTELGRFPNKAVQVSGDPLSAPNENGGKKRSRPDKVHVDSL